MKRSKQFLKIVKGALTVWVLFGLLFLTADVSIAEVVFRYGMGTDISRLDPTDSTDNPTELVNSHIYEGLVRFNENMEILPALATSWEFTDGKTLVFHLRKGVKFQDHTAFNAQAVKYHFADRLLGPSPLRRTQLYKPYIESVEVIDENTVTFHLTQPFGAILHHLAHVAGKIVSPAAVEKYGKEIGAHPVGTGPFQFVERVPGERIVLKTFADYWGPKPQVDRLVFQIIPEDATRAMMLETGDLDLALRIPPDDIKRMKALKDVEILQRPSVLNMYIGIHTQIPPLEDQRVRQALNYAVDKKLISETILADVSTPADSPLSPVTWGYYSTGLYPYDPGKAKQLLAEAGWRPGANGVYEKGGKPFSVELWSPIGRYLKDTRVAEVVSGQLREIGLDVKLKTFEWGAYLAHVGKPLNEAKQQLFLLAWGPSTADADWVLRPLFHSTMFKPTGSNRFFYKNEQVDSLIEAQMNTVDAKKRFEICRQAQEKIMQDAALIPIAAIYQVIGVRSNVKNVAVLATDHVLVTEVRLTK